VHLDGHRIRVHGAGEQRCAEHGQSQALHNAFPP
jgi:hypothetical protein